MKITTAREILNILEGEAPSIKRGQKFKVWITGHEYEEVDATALDNSKSTADGEETEVKCRLNFSGKNGWAYWTIDRWEFDDE